jgi:predicted RNase H-like HicB family nuclease
VATEAIAAVSSTVKGERYTSTVNKSENGYDATVPVAPPITVHGDSPQQVEKAISQMVDYYA